MACSIIINFTFGMFVDTKQMLKGLNQCILCSFDNEVGIPFVAFIIFISIVHFCMNLNNISVILCTIFPKFWCLGMEIQCDIFSNLFS